MKKCKDLYKEEKQPHEEALQRYQEDHMNEIEIISQIIRLSPFSEGAA